MNISKTISILFHPILLPFIGTLYFFILKGSFIHRELKYSLSFLVLIVTYIIPLVLLFILKKLKRIDNYELKNIEQRKIPLLLMIVLFFVLGNLCLKNRELFELSSLFIGASLALTITYFLFISNFKTSIHTIGTGAMLGFLLLFSYRHEVNLLLEISLAFVINGLVAQARLNLKAHTKKEVFYGFFIGFLTQFTTYSIYIVKLNQY